MYRFLSAVAAALMATSAAATDRADVMSVVHQWIDALDKGDMKTFVALCAEQSSILDDFPPYEWLGSNACSKWWGDFEALGKSEDITNGSVTLGTPLQFTVTADHAYLVTRDVFSYNLKGKPMKQTGAIHTIVLRKTDSGWRITGEAWASISLAKPEASAP
jgi:ketosteroid isomerase-like protein